MLKKIMFQKLAFILGNKLEESHIIFIYRYISLFVTSTFYLLGDFQHSIYRKIFIIGCLSISSIILSYLYIRNEESERNIKVLLLIETIGNSVLLIPSGGINSPFIWYTLNTILISSIFLKNIYCYLNLLVYILAFLIIANIGFNGNMHQLGITIQHSNLILSLIMIVAAVQVWSLFVNKLKEKNQALKHVNNQLELANQRIMEYVELIESLYKSVNILTNQGNKDGLIKILYDYTKEITNSNVVFYYDVSEDIHRIIIDSDDDTIISSIKKNMETHLANILDNKNPMEIQILDRRFAIVPIRTTHKSYGILGCEINIYKEGIIYRNNLYQLQFLSELMPTTLERLYLEEVNERLLLSEEQNRIANEIHDSVLQRLFGLSCGIFSLIKRLDNLHKEDIIKELDFMRNTIATVMKELREKIYGLSWKKSGSNSFIADIKNYIEETRRLNNVVIPFSITGDDELLLCEHKKVLYRAICEGISNAVRHGKASNIEVSLNIESEEIILSIVDDGIGFDLNEVLVSKTRGLGIHNLYQMSESLGGNTIIDSTIGKGTKIRITIPYKASEKEEALYESANC